MLKTSKIGNLSKPNISSLTLVFDQLRYLSFAEAYNPERVAAILKLILAKTGPLSCEAVKSLLARFVRSECDEFDLVRLLLNHPRQPGFRLDVEQSSLVIAALFGNYKMLEVLTNEPHNINGCQAYAWWGLNNVNFCTKFYRCWDGRGNLGRKMLFPDCAPILMLPLQIPTPLFGGIMSRSLEVVQLLIDKGADVNAITPLGTPLFFASGGTRSESMVRLLIQNQADIITYDAGGNEQPSPLVIAAAKGAFNIVDTLLKAGAKVDQGSASAHSIYGTNRGGHKVIKRKYPSAIEAAEMEGHKEVAKLLREYKAKTDATAAEEVTKVMTPGQIEELEDDCTD
ncbi:hypothetical protein SBOR_4883 [Sclerotinia borealis F-4128]|uniref:Uncharacterized protein n=1 Tax=Sclerotinia borealis (strain F-4128) TaxID=1432307 RepID=W9CFS8_SCLBF|nr:hypothetical protein SBOR_4883 [Sclerotinia borealis F-4128]